MKFEDIESFINISHLLWMFTSCNERKGNTRCEGCNQLYCISCMSEHHGELMIHFELLIGTQKELKESFVNVESNWQTNQEHPCLTAVDQWEKDIIDRIQQIAAKARTTIHEMMTKNLSDMRRRLDQLAFDMEQRQQEGNYLDNDIAGVRNQLKQLDHDIKHVHEKIRINCSGTNKIDWNSLLYISSKKKTIEKLSSLPELPKEVEEEEEDTSTQEKIWNSLRKFLKTKYSNSEYISRQSSFRQTTPSIFEPIALTSYDSSNYSTMQRNIKPKSESTDLDSFQSNPFSNEDPFQYITFTTIDQEQLLPQASDV
ncbi:hypothetical protein I4U23_020781 [Adineta vaga]|nr:hypothetical protein I4U23_020781 [Adineta vaga]